ncbi:MAG TPA: hypothetical protein VFZ53_19060 [Polyangiaceae bacterium]
MARLLGAFAVVVLAACSRGSDGASPKPGAGGTSSGGSGGGGAGGSAGSEDLRAVAAVLDGFVMKQPCLSQSGPRACRTHAEAACPANAEPALAGARPFDEALTFGGEAGRMYDVTLRVQGVVESKVYANGTDVSELPTNGLQRAGTPDNSKNQRSLFALRVASPPATYFFNALGRDALRRSVFAVDYEAALTIQGGTAVQAWIADPNCEAVRNCGDPDDPAVCVPVDVPDFEPKIRATLGVEPSAFDGQFLGFAVKSVTARN